MNIEEFLKALLAASVMGPLSHLKILADKLPRQDRKMPVMFTSHGNPMDIPLTREERPFWQALYDLGRVLQAKFDIKAALVVSAHWCTRGSFVNISPEQTQIYDYYGFPKHYYDPWYRAQGAPATANQVSGIVPGITETTEWGLDHGAWPMLMHLFPEADVPVFQLSIDYYAAPRYHYELGQQLKPLRNKGVLIIGSGSLIHNLQLAGQKMARNDMSPYGWEAEYDAWIKERLDKRDLHQIIDYRNSHPRGKLAAPTPDHYVPVLYSLGAMDPADQMEYFYEAEARLPAFSERSFLLS